MREKTDFFSKLVICALGALLFGYVIIKYLLGVVLPFLIAWGVAFAVRSPARFLSSKLKLSERILRLILSAALVLSGLSLVFFLIWKLVTEGFRLLSRIGENGELFGALSGIMNPRGALTGVLPDGVAKMLSGALEGAISRLSDALADFAAGFISALPSVFLFIVVSLIACIYFALDLERVNAFVKSKLPPKIFSGLVRFKDGLFGVGVRYARAYFALMLITFSVCSAGLLLLGVDYAVLIALIISLLDILPVIGIGTVLVPWAVFQLAFGSRALGVGLLILFLIAEFIRQLAEPKIVGKNLGLHPVVSLVLLYGSYSIFGLVGILLIPALVVIVNALLNKNNSAEVKKRSVREENGS